MEIKAEIKSIKKILVDDEKFYQIPDYQRPYSWDRDNLDDLIEDLTTSYITDKNEDYFCGSLVLVNNKDDKRFDIIDGQQRTTTFSIIACVIRDFFASSLEPRVSSYIKGAIQDVYNDNKRKLKFLTSDNYQLEFEETVLKKVDSNSKAYNNKYFINAHTILKLLEEKIIDLSLDINDFTQWFFEKVVLTVITCPSEDSAIQIFNVLNDRGMPLSPIDILKASLMQELVNKNDRNAFKNKWEQIVNNLKIHELSFENMLNTYLYFKLGSNPKFRLDKELKAIFKKEGIDANSVLMDIDKFSISYIKVFNSRDKHIHCFKYLRHQIYWTSIIVTAEYCNYPHLDKLKELLLAYYYQNWIAGATVARIKQTSFNILKRIKKLESISDIKAELTSNLNRYKTTDKFLDAINDSWVYGRKWDKSLLLLLEYFSKDDDDDNFISINNKLHLEHILPRTTTEYWDDIFNDDEKAEWTNSLANLTLLSLRKNVQAQNYSFEDKKKAYKYNDDVVSSFVLTQDVLQCDKWDVEELKKREKKLQTKIKEKIHIF